MATDVWREDELDLVVADYFAMLAADLSKKHYVKSHHRTVLMDRIDRNSGSIEFKHQNISAVLDELGLPWIPGYKPRSNYQKSALPSAIDRYLTEHPAIFKLVPAVPAIPPSPAEMFVSPPVLSTTNDKMPERLRRLVRKFDPMERDHHNYALGKAGEEFVVNLERRELAGAGRSDLARKVRWVADVDGDGAGYDVLSFDLTGRERLLEIKTTNGSARTPFFLSRNERDMAMERPKDWCIYRVHLFANTPRIFAIAPPLENAIHLRPDTWRASF
ncbi:MAG: DUF3883 domain-containing protein [Acidobacteriota bacterium]